MSKRPEESVLGPECMLMLLSAAPISRFIPSVGGNGPIGAGDESELDVDGAEHLLVSDDDMSWGVCSAL
ncbi:hypothetical protein RRF57_001450 [Xylaria bambusicola]|uniref:Uncharacterized protein n=1 Tax=Xylaria bambusicola TaxID=326684 RepID=A0AAN7UBI6_9PEZI